MAMRLSSCKSAKIYSCNGKMQPTVLLGAQCTVLLALIAGSAIAGSTPPALKFGAVQQLGLGTFDAWTLSSVWNPSTRKIEAVIGAPQADSYLDIFEVMDCR